MSNQITTAVKRSTEWVYSRLGGTLQFSKYIRTVSKIDGSITWSPDPSVGEITAAYAQSEHTFVVNHNGIGVRQREPVFHVASKPFDDAGQTLDSDWRIGLNDKQYSIQLPILQGDGTYFVVRYKDA